MQTGIVLDPFAGTGTALLAAGRRGRRAVGIDIRREYLERAAARLEAEQSSYQGLHQYPGFRM
jgi:DNA modification methylase